MTDSEDGSQGLSGWAGYQLGVMASESARTREDFFAACWARKHPQPKVYAAEEVHEVIQGWKNTVQFHQERIERIKEDRAIVRVERDELCDQNARLQAELELERTYAAAQRTRGDDWERSFQAAIVREIELKADVAELEAAVAYLRKEVARLEGERN